MKSFYRYFLISLVLVSIIPLSSCRKGPNDPFLSLRSRTARLTGVWKLVKADYTVTTINTKSTPNVVTTVTSQYVYDGAKRTTTTTMKIGNGTPVTNSSSETYSDIWTINKDNSYTETMTESGDVSVATGSWAWLHKDKDADLKNKEAVMIFPEKNTNSGITSSNGKTDQPNTMIIDELKNKELVFTIDQRSDDGKGSNDGVVMTIKGTLTYQQ